MVILIQQNIILHYIEIYHNIVNYVLNYKIIFPTRIKWYPAIGLDTFCVIKHSNCLVKVIHQTKWIEKKD